MQSYLSEAICLVIASDGDVWVWGGGGRPGDKEGGLQCHGWSPSSYHPTVITLCLAYGFRHSKHENSELGKMS